MNLFQVIAENDVNIEYNGLNCFLRVLFSSKSVLVLSLPRAQQGALWHCASSQRGLSPLSVFSVLKQHAFSGSMSINTTRVMTAFLGLKRTWPLEAFTLLVGERTVPTTTSVTKLSLNSTLGFPSSELPSSHPQHAPLSGPPRRQLEDRPAKAGQSLACANAVSCLFAFSEPQRRMLRSSHGQPEGSC